MKINQYLIYEIIKNDDFDTTFRALSYKKLLELNQKLKDINCKIMVFNDICNIKKNIALVPKEIKSIKFVGKKKV